MVRTYFSVASAEGLLSSLTPLVRKAQDFKRLVERHARIAQHEVATEGGLLLDIDENLDAEQHTLEEQFYESLESVEKHGCVVRSVEEGIVDFYTRFEGRDVFLSWRLGERKIRFWHELDEDAPLRKHIVELR